MITVEMLKERLDYNSETGVFIWKPIPTNKAWTVKYAGKIAGSKTNMGYGQISFTINKKQYHIKLHTVAWALYYNEFPSMNIDHINGIKLDNRICNLRLATVAENSQNIFKAKSTNKLGLLGAHKIGKRFFSTIMLNGISTHLGYFNTALEAHNAYIVAKRDMHPFNQL